MGTHRGVVVGICLLAGLALNAAPIAAHALEGIEFSMQANAPSARVTPRTAADDDDEDAFFSSGARTRSTGTVVATTGPLPRAAALPQPTVDVVETCRAVLADNLNYYNHNFIEGCHRALRQSQRP